ncbi:telomerase reverse transcriptase [Apostichopus japonicus]|uniref:Telomerase reverse transcriptase n=1 Tax=Stichopus japonicus TaxID=307972 RepID=A0A2G8LKF6_STIJA|nr:telomerase reverse transcriptase [Apostichopus japonicus]
MTGTEVYVSLRGLLKKIIPMEIWGSTTNQNAFFKYVKLMVKLGRFEKLPLDLLKKSLRAVVLKVVLPPPWGRWEVSGGRYSCSTTLLRLQSVRMNWPIPKAKWKTMEETALSDYKKLGVLSEIDQDDGGFAENLGKVKTQVYSKRERIPPHRELGKSSLPGKEKYDINFLLRDALDIFNYLWRDYPKLFGFSRLGVTSIYPKWREFVVKRKQNGDSRPLYFVKMDISKCYDSIPQDKLFRVITTNLKQKELPSTYVIRRYWVTTITRHGDVRKTVMRYVSPADGIRYDTRSCHQILVDLAKNGRHHNSIITNQVSVRVEGVDSILKKLQQLIHNDIVSINNHNFLRTKGISHGSVLSSLLCSMFYGHMETQFLTDVDKDGLLMRLIDDFFLVTPHLDIATNFLETLFSAECSEIFGCHINPSKTLTNFSYVYNGQQLQQVAQDWFPWCGFLFNTKTLDVRNNYQRYESTSFRYSMTVSFTSDDIINAMKITLTHALLRSKGLVIFIDPLINSPGVIIENVYHLLLLTAFRFHSYFQALPQHTRQQDSSRLLGMILDIASTYYFKVKKVLRGTSEKSTFPLSLAAMRWLCVKAFHVKLSRHFGVHKMLVVRLRQKRRELARKLDRDTRKALAGGSIPDIPPAFIKTRC